MKTRRLIKLLLTSWAVLSNVASAAEPSDYDGQSWVVGPVVLVADVSGVEGRQPGAGPALFGAIERAAAEWNAALGLNLLQVVSSGGPVSDSARALGDGVSGIYFSPRISTTQGFAAQFGYADSRRADNGLFSETDLIFNPAHDWFVYDGPIQYTSGGERVAEMHRVALHEFGHLLGIAHPPDDGLATIMRSRMGDLDALTPRDRAGARQAAAVIQFRNRPRLTRLTPGSSGVMVTGTSNRFFVRRLWVETDGPGGRERVRIPVRRQWRVRVPVSGGERGLALVYRPRGGTERVVAVRRALRE